MTCDICRETYAQAGDEPDCAACFPGMEPGVEHVIEAVGRFGPIISNGMGGLDVQAVYHALVITGGDVDDVELLAGYFAELRQAQDEYGKQADKA